MSELLKAFKNGKRGKFRRIDGGKLKFIRSEDGVVEKDVTSTAGMEAQLGSPAAEVHRTDTPGVKCRECGVAKCTCLKKEFPAEREAHAQDGVEICKFHGAEKEKCECGKVEKAACDCEHPGLCKDAADCDCDCTDRATCEHRGPKVDVPSTMSVPENVMKLDQLISTLEAKLG